LIRDIYTVAELTIILLSTTYFPYRPSSFFFFIDTATSEIYTLSLHDALPIFSSFSGSATSTAGTTTSRGTAGSSRCSASACPGRSEEHTSELQSRGHLVCRLLLEKKKAIYADLQSIPPDQQPHSKPGLRHGVQ